jgi:hypothetical protein
MAESVDFRQAIQTVFQRYVGLARTDRGVELIAVCDAETGNYLLMNVGWSGRDRIHSVVVHLRAIGEQIRVEWNGTDTLIDDLIESGLREEDFVPASP